MPYMIAVSLEMSDEPKFLEPSRCAIRKLCLSLRLMAKMVFLMR